MNVALIGYGRMGHEVESAALERGHAIKVIIDEMNISDLKPENFREVDVAIEFTVPHTAFTNIRKCLEMAIPVVSGTTGWLHDYDKAVQLCRDSGTSFIHSSNFSIGVNILFRINGELASLMERYDTYRASVEEIHHIKKLDSPSGTAITLANGISARNKRYKGWSADDIYGENMIPVHSVREGTVPGTHIVLWDSETDSVMIRHEARNRKGFALGAIIAAEFISRRKGIFTMDDILNF